MTLLVVSPHLDDAVLSATSALLDGAEVVTVFAGVPAADAPLGPWDAFTGATSSAVRAAQRLDEDDAALAVLGVDGRRRLGLLDHQYRTRDHLPSEVRAALAGELAGVTSLLLPAAVGRHPDHLLARDAGLVLAREAGLAVRLYADVPHATPFGWPSAVTGLADPPFADISGWLLLALVAAGLDPGAWELQPVALDAAAVAAKRVALGCYPTQLPALDQLGAGLVSRDDVIGHEVVWSPTA